MDWEQIDWAALERLRTRFLQGTGGAQDYWESDRDLASYDLTFAQRIGWKWDYVLEGLQRRGWTPPAGDILDWGCGSGVAGRAFLDRFGFGPGSLLLWDRSPLAVAYAERRARERFPDLNLRRMDRSGAPAPTVLLSHVLTELNEPQISSLLELIGRATAVLWVEPGTYEVSRKLIAARERLRECFQVVAPCPHQAVCGMLASENAPHWCHHFASPPPAVFTDGNWAKFAHLAGVDLRSLPLSFLVLDRRPVSISNPGTRRIIGRPRVYKAHALLFGCDAAAVREHQLNKREFPDQFRQLRKGNVDPFAMWEPRNNR